MKFNKQGTEKILAIYWFVILILVAGGIFAMVYSFYHSPYDVRNIEAQSLINKVADCISQRGILQEDFLKQENLLEHCNLNFNSEGFEDWEKEVQYYVEVEIYSLQDENNPSFQIFAGNEKWKPYCGLQKEKQYEKLVKCVEERFYGVGQDNTQYLIKILSIVRKTEKNVR